MPRLLIIDTATTALSIALFEDDLLIASDHRTIGRGHAEQLIPAIAALPDGGRCDGIAVDVGPGSFTGIRVGLAAAKGLGLAWGVPVTGYSALALTAADAVAGGIIGDFTAAINGGHGQAFVQHFSADPFAAIGEAQALELADLAAQPVLVGAAPLADHAPHMREGQIDARNYMHLPAPLRNLPATPLYLRGADAKPMAAT